MTTDTAIAQAVWEYATRTLTSGSPAAPAGRLDRICKAVWEYETRTLTEGGGGEPNLVGVSGATAGAAGVISLLMALSGKGTATGSAAAALSLGLGLQGQASATSGVVAPTLTLALSLSGQADAISAAMATLDLEGRVGLSGSAQGQAGAEGTLSLLLSLTGTVEALAGAVGTLRDAGVSVSYVWSLRGMSAGWGTMGEWYDPDAAGTPAAGQSGGEILN